MLAINNIIAHPGDLPEVFINPRKNNKAIIIPSGVSILFIWAKLDVRSRQQPLSWFSLPCYARFWKWLLSGLVSLRTKPTMFRPLFFFLRRFVKNEGYIKRRVVLISGVFINIGGSRFDIFHYIIFFIIEARL
jgi:hypothetical protein